ncbi:MAG: DUF4126 domain-containing protein [Betaproteobacteria bacterium]
MALAWGAGVRVYVVLFLCGLAGRMGWIALPGHLAVLSHPLVLGASGLMLSIEFFADKVPWLDSFWDAAHTFIRIPAGAALVAMAAGGDSAAVTAAAVVLGGTVAAGSHFAKAGARGAINLSPEPFSNWSASFAEDALVPTGLWLAVVHPAVFLALFAAAAVATLFLLRWLWRGLRSATARLRSG